MGFFLNVCKNMFFELSIDNDEVAKILNFEYQNNKSVNEYTDKKYMIIILKSTYFSLHTDLHR